MGIYLKNSILAVLPSLVLIVILGVAAGFALEVMIFKGRASVLLYFLLGIMFPGQMILLPLRGPRRTTHDRPWQTDASHGPVKFGYPGGK